MIRRKNIEKITELIALQLIQLENIEKKFEQELSDKDYELFTMKKNLVDFFLECLLEYWENKKD